MQSTTTSPTELCTGIQGHVARIPILLLPVCSGTCEGSGDVAGVLTLLVGGVAQAFHDDRVVELRVQLGVEEVEGKGQGGSGRSRKGETSQKRVRHGWYGDGCEKTQNLSQ